MLDLGLDEDFDCDSLIDFDFLGEGALAELELPVLADSDEGTAASGYFDRKGSSTADSYMSFLIQPLTTL